ncbi:hypothetical protein M9H77_01893 [Catharanthus roseus]|uniref:Uncharacterized protein n=1 Tax=Catharanthus roseus TaxID=4058 RepID=A0ACC0C797_CATRO|nr:hypothetical protein M9H77_01893 [Catharanthus roseus]
MPWKIHSQGFSNSSAASNESSSSCPAARIPSEINHFLARVCSSGLSQVTNNLRGSRNFIIQNPPSSSEHLTNDIVHYNTTNIDPNLGSTSTVGLKELPIMAP